MLFLTPRYIKHARLLHKGVTRFMNYKRDLLPAAKLDEIATMRSSLEDAIKAKDRSRITALTDEINRVCEKALPEARHSEFADNIEVFFVAIVVALGIRGYIAQPFKIPTGSMQPTLNGIIAKHTEEPPNPSLVQRVTSFFTGRSYFNVISDHEGYLRSREPITEHNFLLWTHCKIHFQDGHTIKVSAPMRQLLVYPDGLGLQRYLQLGLTEEEGLTPDAQRSYSANRGGNFIRKGQILARGVMDTGDHVLVNKFSYHFRRPARGEVFVFTTKHIVGIEKSGSFLPEHGSQHYIKRLAAVPGDTFEVKPPELWINGHPSEEFGPKRVAASEEPGYNGYQRISPTGNPYHTITNEGTLARDEYLALGDNSGNSLDSRYWGAVPERNLVGPALMCYWPLNKHWGLIR